MGDRLGRSIVARERKQTTSLKEGQLHPINDLTPPWPVRPEDKVFPARTWDKLGELSYSSLPVLCSTMATVLGQTGGHLQKRRVPED